VKLNDPFGRLESRHQRGYESMRDSLQKAGIETSQDAQQVISQAWRRGFTFIGAVVLVMMLLSLLIPKALPLTLGLSLFVIVWVLSSTINGQRYVKRYIEEELKRSEND
jgi:predicted aldo/keto reductase-like oxidoreductase